MKENAEELVALERAVYAANLVVGEQLGPCEGIISSGWVGSKSGLTEGGGGVVNCYMKPGLRFDSISSKFFTARLVLTFRLVTLVAVYDPTV